MKKLNTIQEVFDNYVQRFKYIDFATPLFDEREVKAIVVIPCHNEESITDCLLSLVKGNMPTSDYQVIVVVNACIGSNKEILIQNQQSSDEMRHFVDSYPEFQLQIIRYENMPEKTGGVGLARKVGMDEAARRFAKWGSSRGVIICLDADCVVARNYMEAIMDSFEHDAEVGLASIHYHHITQGLEPRHQKAITDYEKHLQYYEQAIQFAGHPNSFQTIGSSMAVTALPYLLNGGMNTRKAGEDFYFMHKLAKTAKHIYISATTVFPSARISDRVPFGTGKAMGDILGKEDPDFQTYHPHIFAEIRQFMQMIKSFYQESSLSFSVALQAFADQQQYAEKLLSVKKQASTEAIYLKRLFHWFDGFEVLKMVHYLRDHHYGTQSVEEAMSSLELMKSSSQNNFQTI